MSLGYEMFIALRYLKAKRKQTFISLITLISILGVAVGTAALVIALALMTGFEEDIKDRIFSGNAHIQVMRMKGGRDIGELEPILTRLEELPSIAAVAPVAEGFGLLSGGASGTGEKAEFQGIDPVMEKRVATRIGTLVSGSFDDLSKWDGSDTLPPVVLGVDLANALGVETGDRLQATLVSPRLTPWGVMPRTLWVRVAGVFDAGFYDYNAVRCYMPLGLACRLFNVDGASWISARAVSTDAIPEAESEIRNALGDDFFVDNMLRRNRALLAALKWEKLTLFVAISLIVMVGALNIVSTLILLVMEKVHDIGALVAMGATSRGIMTLFLVQGLVIGLLGTFSGVALGTVVSVAMDAWQVIRLDPDVYYISHVPFHARPLDALGVALLAVAISFLATLYPSWKASRLDPVQALRYE